MKFYLNFSLFYHIAIQKKTNKFSKPKLVSFMLFQPEQYEFAGSSSTYFVSGSRKPPHANCLEMQERSIDEIRNMLSCLNIQNLDQSLNIFCGLISDGIILLDREKKEYLLHLLRNEEDSLICLAVLYRECFFDMNQKLELDKGKLNLLQSLFEKYGALDRFAAIPLGPEEGRGGECLCIDTRYLYGRIAKSLCEHMNTIVDKDGASHYGWCRNLDQENKIGFYATADGICIAAMTGCYEDLYISRRQEILSDLWRHRYSEGGFSYETQSFPSLEATINIAKCFLYERDFARFKLALQDLLCLWRTEGSSVYLGEISVAYLALFLDLLLEIDGPADVIEELCDSIMDAAIREDDQRIIFWQAPNVKNSKGSVVHTAMCIYALMRYSRYHEAENAFAGLLSYSINWLLDQSWIDSSEITYRRKTINGKVFEDMIIYEHYSAPWCIRALLASGLHRSNQRIQKEIREIMRLEEDGLWYYQPSNSPQIWVTHEVLDCIRDYQLSAL